ncbi:MAG TPA: hypothetical protein VHV53_00820 [Solirubrobacterales bacterium]|jgi:hypothetical protein|nr:hypothetical protein [Solirubrobacterales bacterium]
MNWARYIALAKVMAHQPHEEMERSAISRAYYGAFNLSRRWLEENVTSIDNQSAHRQVWMTFRAGEPATADTRSVWRQVGTLGGALRALRNQADYDDRVPDLETRTREAVDFAERILKLLPELEVA